MIGKIQRVRLRDVWAHEALNFTTWLEENIEILGETIDLDLMNVDREKNAGSFSVDLVAEDRNKDPVVIENQLEKSDHDHLGKLITYLTAIGARTAVWIVAIPRPEHVAAVAWLNESSAADFYLVKLEAIRIGDSAPAPLLTLIVGPSEEARQAGEAKKELAERNVVRKRFWSELLTKAKERTRLHSSISATDYHWVGTGAGKMGLSYNYTVKKNEGRVELYIDRGKDAAEWNAAIFEQLYSAREDIESSFGGPLEWDRIEGKRACIVRARIGIGGYSDEGKWAEIHDAMIDAMIRLERAFSSHIAALEA